MRQEWSCDKSGVATRVELKQCGVATRVELRQCGVATRVELRQCEADRDRGRQREGSSLT